MIDRSIRIGYALVKEDLQSWSDASVTKLIERVDQFREIAQVETGNRGGLAYGIAQGLWECVLKKEAQE